MAACGSAVKEEDCNLDRRKQNSGGERRSPKSGDGVWSHGSLVSKMDVDQGRLEA